MIKLAAGTTIKTQAWMIRRLISLFSRTAKRPHQPRQADLRAMMQEVGMLQSQPGYLLALNDINL